MVGRTVAVVHEQHVDVGRIGQLSTTQPAHADDGERQLGLERAQRRLDARISKVSELA